MELREIETGKRYREFRGRNGSGLCEQDGCLYLVISYDDIQDDEIDAFRNASCEVIFKTFGLGSLFTFKFSDHIVDAPFNQFSESRKGGAAVNGKAGKIPVVILAGESSTGEVIVKRETVLPQEFCREFDHVLAEQEEEYGEKYDLKLFNRGIRDIYDNHVIEEIYWLPGDREITCMVQ